MVSYFTCKSDFDRGINNILASISNYQFLDHLLFQEAKEEGGTEAPQTMTKFFVFDI